MQQVAVVVVAAATGVVFDDEDDRCRVHFHAYKTNNSKKCARKSWQNTQRRQGAARHVCLFVYAEMQCDDASASFLVHLLRLWLLLSRSGHCMRSSLKMTAFRKQVTRNLLRCIHCLS